MKALRTCVMAPATWNYPRQTRSETGGPITKRELDAWLAAPALVARRGLACCRLRPPVMASLCLQGQFAVGAGPSSAPPSITNSAPVLKEDESLAR